MYSMYVRVCVYSMYSTYCMHACVYVYVNVL